MNTYGFEVIYPPFNLRLLVFVMLAVLFKWRVFSHFERRNAFARSAACTLVNLAVGLGGLPWLPMSVNFSRLSSIITLFSIHTLTTSICEVFVSRGIPPKLKHSAFIITTANVVLSGVGVLHAIYEIGK